MKTIAMACLAVLLVVDAGTADHFDGRSIKIHNLHCWQVDHIEYDIDDGSLFITHDSPDYETIEITEQYELYINGEKIVLDDHQQALVQDYYDLTMEMVSRAKKIGLEGARVGLEGAKLGIKAVGKVMKMLLTDYDEDDFDRDMEYEAQKIEAKAEILEEKAELIEYLAEEAEMVAEEMREAIPELDRQKWFKP